MISVTHAEDDNGRPVRSMLRHRSAALAELVTKTEANREERQRKALRPVAPSANPRPYAYD